MERIIQVHAAAEAADIEYYSSLTPKRRLDILLELIEIGSKQYGSAAERFTRVSRIVPLKER